MALQTVLLAAYGPAGAGSYGIYNCRPIAPGAPELSIHAEGRALDLSVPEGGALGDVVLERLLAAAGRLGLQRIIYWGQQYDRHSPLGTPYGGDNPHLNHLHIEQTRDAAATLTEAQAHAALFAHVPRELEMHLLVEYQTGVVVVAADLSSRTTLASRADQEALMATGLYRVAVLSASQVARIPIAGHEGSDQGPDESGPM